MSELEWFERGDGVWCGPGCDAQVCWQGEVKGWLWTVPGAGSGHCETLAKAQIAALGVTVAMHERRLDDLKGALARAKQAAQDADDAALVAPVDPAWLVHDAGHAILHAAVVAGHKCIVSVQPSGHVKWELEPEHERHPYTWDAPDLETAKIRAAAEALRTPCKRWLVEIPDQALGQREIKGGAVEVWAMTSEGAMHRACEALEIRSFGRTVKGNVMEVRL